MSSRPDLKLDWCSYAAAKYAVEHWHYSRTMPRSKNVFIGVWESAEFVGALVFGLGAGNATNGRRWGLAPYFQVAELERVALRSHQTPVSKIISIAIRLLRHQSPGLRLLISYADPFRGHHGGVYQAANWKYVGDSASGKVFIDQAGREHHERHVSEAGYKHHWGKVIPALKPSEARETIRVKGKHIYLFALDDEIHQRILPLAQPYPKRVGSIENDASAIPGGNEGGVIPTPTLQEANI